MPDYLGDFQRGTVFSTLVDLFANGVATSLVGATLSAYKNASATQTVTGVTLVDVDHDALTGLHLITIDLSADATFYSPQSEIFIIVTAGTLDGASQIPRVLFSFSIENRHVAGVLVRTTIATLASQTSFTLTAGSADNNTYIGSTIVISDAASAIQKAIGVVSAYTGSTRTVALAEDPGIFTMANGDFVTIIANRSLRATIPSRALDVSATGEAGLDWANIGAPTTSQTLSGTTVGTVSTVSAVASVTALGTNAITATTIATGAITAAKFAASAIDAAAIASNAFTSAKFASGAFDAVWTVTAGAGRTLTAFSTALAVSVWDVLASAVATASSIGLQIKTNLDVVLSTRLGSPSGASLSADILVIKTKTDNLPGAPAAVGSAMTLTSGERDAIAGALLDLANGVETSVTVRKALRGMAAMLCGDVAGATTGTELFKSIGNPGTTRVTVPVDGDGNRTGVTVS